MQEGAFCKENLSTTTLFLIYFDLFFNKTCRPLEISLKIVYSARRKKEQT